MAPTIGKRDGLDSVAKRGLTRYLYDAANGVCPLCGVAMVLNGSPSDPDSVQVSHVRPASSFGPTADRGGFVSGNLFAGCRRCNARTADRDLSPLVPFLNPPAWSVADLRAAGKITNGDGASPAWLASWERWETML